MQLIRTFFLNDFVLVTRRHEGRVPTTAMRVLSTTTRCIDAGGTEFPGARIWHACRSPQLVAQLLLARRPNPRATDASCFIPAGMQLNVLSAAWIQANLHGWLDHVLDTSTTLKFTKGATAGCPLKRFNLHPTKYAAATNRNQHNQDSGNTKLCTQGGLRVPNTVYENSRTAWWDASFLYGQSEDAVMEARTLEGGRLHESSTGVPLGPGGEPLVGDQVNTWVGITMLQVRTPPLRHGRF